MTDSVGENMTDQVSSGLNKNVFKDFALEDLVHSKLESFIDQIQGYEVSDLYPIILERVERPLIQLVLKKTRGNQVRAAQILGINRNTLRKKINHLKIKVKKPYIEE
jgi:two-component system nitrogen regulation response regulator GlnG